MPYAFECSAVIPDCDWRVVRDTQEETVDEIDRHAREAHDMAELPEEVTNKVLASIHPAN